MTSIEIQENVLLAPFTTMKVGGFARYFVVVKNETEVKEALDFAAREHLSVFILGGGSNVLIADSGFDGLVIYISLKGISDIEISDLSAKITVQAGENWDGFVSFCVERELAGVECLSGIPGLVGGTPVQNVGAYGQEVAESIVSVRCLDRKTNEIVVLTNRECDFAYRRSIFNTTDIDRYVVVSVIFSLILKGEPKIAYKDIQEHFGDRKPSIRDVREAVLAIRRSKSMVIDIDDPNALSAGSFFKNPIVARSKYSELADSFEGIPSFNFDESNVKIPAAWLIEHAGFHKGYSLGQAGISTKHTLAIVNRGDATAAGILALQEKIQFAVAEKFDIFLSPEPRFVGFSE